MARYRSRSRSHGPRRRSRTPLRGRERERERHEDEYRRDARLGGDRRSPAPSGLLIRNLPLNARPEDLRISFERFGPVKDIYLPRNYYTGVPRGFGFVKFCYPEDAAEAKHRMNYKLIGGREIRIVFAEENRKTPQEMRMVSNTGGRQPGNRRSLPRSPRHRYRSYSRSLSPTEQDSRREYRTKEMRVSPRAISGRYDRVQIDEKNIGRSRSRSPKVNNDSFSRSRLYSVSPR